MSQSDNDPQDRPKRPQDPADQPPPVPLDYARPGIDPTSFEQLQRFLRSVGPRQWAFAWGLAFALGGLGVALGAEEAALLMGAGALLVGLAIPLRGRRDTDQ